MRAKAGTGMKPPKPEPLVSPDDLISPRARAPLLQQPGAAGWSPWGRGEAGVMGAGMSAPV